jgi:hypothetical protein
MAALDVNRATGLPMMDGGVDVMGNPYGLGNPGGMTGSDDDGDTVHSPGGHKTELLRWVEERLNPESRISGLLFQHCKDPKHKRSKYTGVKFEVTDAWIVEYSDTPAPSA